MIKEPIANERLLHEGAVTERFLDFPNETSFGDLFKAFTPRLVAFFRARNCEATLAQDLAQEVMFTVYRKASQIRDRSLFRACQPRKRFGPGSRPWYFGRIPAFEFNSRMGFLDSREREVITLCFIEQWEYYEIAAARPSRSEQSSGAYSTQRRSWRPIWQSAGRSRGRQPEANERKT
jgi:hypothetical protein